MKNKIGWCNLTWNPVWGCLNHCEYCYARGIAKRFYNVIAEKEHKYREYVINVNKMYQGEHRLRDFVPTFLYSQFNKKLPKKPQRIFVGSMSEIYYWDEEWIEKVIEKVKQYPQHTFQFLTKFPRVYSGYEFPKNCWLGVTITNNPKTGEADRWDFWQFRQDNINNLKFVSFEPLLMGMQLIYFLNLEDIDWVIIGAETGNRKGKVIPEKEWILDIVRYCVNRNIPLYLKDNIKDICPEEIKEFPKERK